MLFTRLWIVFILLYILSGCTTPESIAFSRWQGAVDKYLESSQNKKSDSLFPTIEAFRPKNIDSQYVSNSDVWQAQLSTQFGQLNIGREVYNYKYLSIKLLYGYRSWVYPRTINVSAVYLGRFLNESHKFDIFMVEIYQELLYPDGFHTRILSVKPAIRLLDGSAQWVTAPSNEKAIEFSKQDFGKHFFDFVLIDQYDIKIDGSEIVVQTKDRSFEWRVILPK